MRIVLFFTRGISLKTWDRVGILERELALYRKLRAAGLGVSFVTYGGRDDLQYQQRLRGIRILCNRWGMTADKYERRLPWLYAPWLATASLFKTNQTNGAGVALRASRLWHKPLLARCGYMWSDLLVHQSEPDQSELERAQQMEDSVFNACKRLVVTTSANKDYATSRYGVPASKISVVPNYVLTEDFVPASAPAEDPYALFVGRMSAEKNPLAVVEACSGLGLTLWMVGDGPLRRQARDTADRVGTPVKWIDRVPHSDLPAIMNKALLFILVSPHEGHPKALLEAMACGLPVVGANSPGIRELIRHGETGWLCGTDPSSIRQAIQRLISDPGLRKKLGQNARKFVVEHFALDKIVDMELGVYREVLGKTSS